MKRTLLLLAVFVISLNGIGQNLITLQHAGNASFYSSILDAYNASVSGDTIYLPGVTYTTPTTWTISKKLHIYGAGHYPDSTVATGVTHYQGSIVFITGSDGSLLTGLKITGTIKVGTTAVNQVVDGLTISRCYLSSYLYLNYDGSGTATTGQNFHIEENVLYNIACGYAKNVYIERNIFYNTYIYYLNGNGINTVRNNVFLYNGSPFSGCSNINVENNIFISTLDPTSGLTSSTFNNNLSVYNLTNLGTNSGSNNIINQAQSSIFVNQTGNAFNYAHDYRVKDTSPGNNGGIDGTDVGVFGTSTPYKAGAVPANPHIRQQTISTTTDVDGKININIKVGAQER